MYKRIIQLLRKLFIDFNLLIRLEGYRRGTYIKKHNLFASVGDNFYFHPWKIPQDSKHIYIGNNVKISSEVLFINHDILDAVLNIKNKTNKYKYYMGEIVIKDNVLIGSRAILLYGITIESNVVVGAGSVCSKDIPAGSIVAGAPARIVGDFMELEKRRLSNYEK